MLSNIVAKVAELVDAPDLGSGFEKSGGSSPSFSRTQFLSKRKNNAWIIVLACYPPVF